MSTWEDIKVFFGGNRDAPTTEEKKKSSDAVNARHINPVTESVDRLLKGVAEKETNYKKISVSSAIKAAVAKELAKDVPNAENLKKAIVKAVDDTLPKGTPPTEAEALQQYNEDRQMLEASAGDLAQKVIELKMLRPTQALDIFNKQMNNATPFLPVSNATLLGGGAAATVTLMRSWDGFKNIAINLGIIAAGLGIGAFVSGDLTTSMFTGPKKKEETKGTSPS